MENTASRLPQRFHDLDWVRVIVTINLVPFHVAWMITSVNGFSFVMKGTITWRILHVYLNFISPLHMFMLFIVAGSSVFISLERRSPRRFIIERVKRLLVPLFTFMIFLFPLLGYFWPSDLATSEFNYFTQFWPWCLMTTFYSEITGGPNWAHMWFVAYLFIFSIILLPLFIRIRATGRARLEAVTGFFTDRKGAIFLAGIPIAMIFAGLSPVWPFFRNNLYSDWGYFTYNMAAFIFGFIIAGDHKWADAIKRHTVISIFLGVALSAAKLFMENKAGSFSTPAYTPRYVLFSLVAGFNTWAWAIAILGLASRTLTFENRFLRYFSRISYPFYIFHLVVISVAGHFVKNMMLGIVWEFLLICLVTFACCIISCDLVKRTRATRFLFGIKGR
ncbi:MAG: acyltransferase family protein [Candidatus Krumholzibacteriota bacterium]|nr:acyltransferase family protein [Candidatus Krumholzibacteriota bacterium]